MILARPYELLPDAGRRGPEALWRGLDHAAAELNRAGADCSTWRACELLAEAAGELAAAVALEDHATAGSPSGAG
jgi:hypothetical protein